MMATSALRLCLAPAARQVSTCTRLAARCASARLSTHAARLSLSRAVASRSAVPAFSGANHTWSRGFAAASAQLSVVEETHDAAAAVVLSELHLVDEVVAVTNRSNDPVDVAGWFIESETGNQVRAGTASVVFHDTWTHRSAFGGVLPSWLCVCVCVSSFVCLRLCAYLWVCLVVCDCVPVSVGVGVG